MDPLSQATVGAVLPMAVAKRTQIRLAMLCGMVGGLVPDLDILIRSQSDPLLSFEYHRQFTHALVSVPFVGLLTAAVLWLLCSRDRLKFKFYYLFTTLGVATHGLLDSCTSYGTYLLWPFSDARITWMNISIIDPLFTLPLLLMLVLSYFYKSHKIAITSVVFACLYLSVSTANMLDVKKEVYKQAELRGHTAERIFVNPTIGNMILWRTVYEYDGYYYVDAVHSVPYLNKYFIEGLHVSVIDVEEIYPELDDNSQQRKDILRFNHFAMNYLYEVEPYQLGDLRYSSIPNGNKPLWGILISPSLLNEHVKVFKNRDREGGFEGLKSMLLKYL